MPRTTIGALGLIVALAACSNDSATAVSEDATTGVGGDSGALDSQPGDATDAGEPGKSDAGSSDAIEPDSSSGDTAAGDAAAGSDATNAAGSCGSAQGELTGGREIQYDDGNGQTSVVKQASWSIGGKKISSEPMHEAVRFDIDRPVEVIGFRVMYDQVVPGKNLPVTAGVYADFGNNGFDFWHFSPLWQGSLCAGDVKPGQWTSFKLDKPVKVEQPGPIYIAHHRESLQDSAWSFSVATPPSCIGKTAEELSTCLNNVCGTFANCHSAWNFPQLTQVGQTFAWPGTSLSRPYNYLVRLQVKDLDDGKPTVLFEPVKDVATGSRQSWGDYDGDGWDDLLINGVTLYRWATETQSFVDATEASGLKKLAIKGSGGVFGDYDNDGCLDLLVFHESANGIESLLHNKCDGTFEDVTKLSGISDSQSYNPCKAKPADPAATHAPSPAAAWLDYDSDGDLDLYVVNFICWTDYSFFFDTIWRNEGGGTFKQVTGVDGWLGGKEKPLSGRGANPADYDGDGHVDLLVNNYTLHRNLLYRSQGDGTVQEVGLTTGAAGTAATWNGNTYYGHSIGAAWGDLDRDGDLDLVVANLAHPRFFNFSSKTEVLINDGKGKFNDVQGDWLKMNPPVGAAGLRYQETHSVPVLADFDNDGKLDLAISCVYDGRPTDFYWGNGDGTFALDVYQAGLSVKNGWGMAAADFDGDGDVDLAAKGVLFRNRVGDTFKQRPKGHWLQVRARGTSKCNRAALGATIRAKFGKELRVAHVSGGSGQGCQNSQVVQLGLGDATHIDSIEINFPGAGKVNFKGPFAADQRLWLYEDGKVHKGVAAP